MILLILGTIIILTTTFCLGYSTGKNKKNVDTKIKETKTITPIEEFDENITKLFQEWKKLMDTEQEEKEKLHHKIIMAHLD